MGTTAHGITIHCECGQQHYIPEADIFRIAGSLSRRHHLEAPVRPKVIRACPYCNEPFGTLELALHRAQCDQNPHKGKSQGRPTVQRECKYCLRQFPTLALRVHQPKCPERPGRVPDNVTVR